MIPAIICTKLFCLFILVYAVGWSFGSICFVLLSKVLRADI